MPEKNLAHSVTSIIKIATIFVLIIMALTSCDGSKVDVNTDTIRTAISMDIDSLNPYKLVSGDSEAIMMNIYEGLVMPDEDGGVRGAIADSWTVSPDGLTYTFRIRDDIKFHNGETLKATDVEFSLNAMGGRIEGFKLAKSSFANVADVKAISDSEVAITLKQPNASFIYHLTTGIVPAANKDELDTNPIGTGPYRIMEYIKEQKLTLAKFDDYYGDKAHIKTVEIIVIPNVETQNLRLIHGELDFMTNVNSKRLNELKDFDIIEGSQNMVILMGLNHKFEPFADKRVREAINLAVDRNEIIQNIMEGHAEPLCTGMTSAMKDLYIGYDNRPVDIERAKSLLAEAGYSDLTFTIRAPSNYHMYANIAQIIAVQLAKIGITVNIENIEYASWLQEVYTDRKYEATIAGFTGKIDPDAIIGRYSSTHRRNFINHNNPRYDEMIAKGRRYNDRNIRKEAYQEAQRILRDDSVAIYIMDPRLIIAMKKGLEGYVFYPTSYINFAKLYWR